MQGMEVGELLINRGKVSVWDNEKVLEILVTVVETLWMYLRPLNCITYDGQNDKFYVIYILPQSK